VDRDDGIIHAHDALLRDVEKDSAGSGCGIVDRGAGGVVEAAVEGAG